MPRNNRKVMRLGAIAGLALAAVGIAPGAAFAAAGDLDPSFAGGTRLLPSSDTPVEVLVAPDGKLVVVLDGGPSGSDFVVTRLNADGSSDKSFGGDGTAVADFGGAEQAEAAALQPDGKLVVAGAAGSDLAVARFTDDGALDATFDPAGGDGDGRKRIPNFGSPPAGVIVQANGKIAIAGSRGGDLAITRLRPNGALDDGEFQPADFGGADATATAAAAAPAPGAAIVVAGRTHDQATPDRSYTAVARYLLDGTLDQTLAGAGKTTIGSIADPTTVLMLPDGKLLVAGDSGGAEPVTVVARLNGDGSPDMTFGDGGTAIVDFEGEQAVASAALAPDGKILVAGTAVTGFSAAEFAAARLNADGTPDATFGAGGLTNFPVGEIASIAGAAAVQPDGRFVLAGRTVTSQLIVRTAVARLLAVPDPSPAGPEGPQPEPRPAPDTVAPRLTGLRLQPARLRTPVTRARIRFTLSESARVRFTLRRAARGGSFRTIAGRFTVRGRAGANRVRAGARIRRLKPGRYRLTGTPTDAAGNRGRTVRLTFTASSERN